MILKSQGRCRSEAHNVFIEKVSKIALSAKHVRRIKTREGVISYPYNTGPGRLYKAELMRHLKIKS